MAGTSNKTKVLTIRVPTALLGELEALAQTRGVTVSALGLEGVQVIVNAGPDVAAPQSSKPRPDSKAITELGAENKRLAAEIIVLEKSLVRVADLEEEIADLKRRLAAKLPKGFGPQPDGATAQPERQVSQRRHQSGPVLNSAVPTNVTGDVEWSALKGSKK